MTETHKTCMFAVEGVTFEEASTLKEAAAAEGVEILDWPCAIWLGVRSHGVGELSGVAAVRPIRGGWWRLAACYVRPWARKDGAGSALVAARIAKAVQRGAKLIDVYSYHPRFFEAKGWEVVREYPKANITRLRWRVSCPHVLFFP